jgi:hypothetical protein
MNKLDSLSVIKLAKEKGLMYYVKRFKESVKIIIGQIKLESYGINLKAFRYSIFSHVVTVHNVFKFKRNPYLRKRVC